MNIFIFHRDLRSYDNTTLIKQIENEKNISPIFIFTPEQVDKKQNKYYNSNSIQFMIESLLELNSDLFDNLKFYYGDTMEILNKLHKSNKINSIGFNIDYTPYAKKRDQMIIDWGKKNDIIIYNEEDFVLHPLINGGTLKSNGTPYVVFTAFKNNLMSNRTKINEVNDFKIKKNMISSINTKFSFELKSDKLFDLIENVNENINVHGGRKKALSILSDIKSGKYKTYSEDRDQMVYNTTFIGAYLHFNVISIREIYQACHNNDGIINELYWRDFYTNITWYFPRVLEGQINNTGNMSYKDVQEKKMKWIYNNELFLKWCNGETGFPIVDACMRQLNTIGYMHNRGRMIVASFLCKDLMIDWRLGEQYFATKLVDYDAMNNNGGWGWVNGFGNDASPYYRVFNPWLQSEKFDKDCVYIKKWLPELKSVPAKDIHKWYKTYTIYKNKINYPEPIVDHDKQRLIALNLIKLSA
jgi:deoxyribodipyrimidine photo-lyase